MKNVFIKLDTIGTDTGLGFNIYDSLGNLLVEGESGLVLLSGVTYSIADNSTWVEIYPNSLSPCSNFLHLDYVQLDNNCIGIFYDYSGTTFNIAVSSFYPLASNITFDVYFTINDGITNATYSVPISMNSNTTTKSATQTVINNGSIVDGPSIVNITPVSDSTYNYVYCPSQIVTGKIENIGRRVRITLDTPAVCPITFDVSGTMDFPSDLLPPTNFTTSITFQFGETVKLSTILDATVTCVTPNQSINKFVLDSNCQRFELTITNPCV